MRTRCLRAKEINCGSWLACDGGVSVKNELTDPPPSQHKYLHIFIPPPQA